MAGAGGLAAVPLLVRGAGADSAVAGELKYKNDFARHLAKAVPRILSSHDTRTGRFGQGTWNCQDQNVVLPLAVAYATRVGANPYYKDPRLLEAIVRGGDALVDDMDENGQWEFRKKDGSTWGKISMPWTYSRWIRAYSLIREDMKPEQRSRWGQGLDRGFAYIDKTQLGRRHNIPTHLAMALYIAGQQLERPAWSEHAARFLRQVAADQAEGGYWAEGQGPLVMYNFVYLDALGIYYRASGDAEVLPAIRRAIEFHRHFTYPSGQAVETIDLRNPYSPAVLPGNPAFTLAPEGRAWLKRQWSHLRGPLNEDALALFLLHGEEGAVGAPEQSGGGGWFVLKEKHTERAATLRQGPWFICLSAYTSPLERDRWHQDRQNLVSIWHEKVGLVIGGGNTKLQPAWSNFTVGDMNLLCHKPGDTSPDFFPKGPLYHVPVEALLVREPAAGLDLKYGPETCRVRLKLRNATTLEYHVEASAQSALPVLAHLTLMPQLGSTVRTARGKKVKLEESAFHLPATELAGALTCHGYRLRLPAQASVHWPALPHDPYHKDGAATTAQGRLEVRFPLDREHPSAGVALEIL